MLEFQNSEIPIKKPRVDQPVLSAGTSRGGLLLKSEVGEEILIGINSLKREEIEACSYEEVF